MKSTNNHSVWLISECSSGLGRELSKAESTAVGVRDIANAPRFSRARARATCSIPIFSVPSVSRRHTLKLDSRIAFRAILT